MKFPAKALVVLAFLFGALLTGCGGTGEDSRAEIVKQIEQYRQKKDRFLRTSPQSPLPDSLKKRFEGLDYFPIDLRYRFRGPLVLFRQQVVDSLPATGGEKRAALRWGYFTILWKKNTYRLLVYRMLDEPEGENLLLAFTDETSGKETYGGGRYVDLVPGEEGTYVLDFNLAYNPYCAYNPTYSCPLPPRENHLPFPVRAGEKKFGSH